MPEKNTYIKSQTYPEQAKNINEYGLSSEKLYDKISEDPQSFTNYYNVLLENAKQKENTPEIKEFLSNINRRFAKDFGFVYDTTTKTGLHPIKENDPKYNEILKYSQNYYKPETETKEEIKKQSQIEPKSYSGEKPTPRHYYGGGSYGVGGENLPEYNWWRQNEDVQNLKNKYPTHSEFFDQNPPKNNGLSSSNQPTKRLNKVENEYDPNDREKTSDGVIFKNPGHRFYKIYDDGSREEISPSEYEKMLPFNSLPEYIKDKYIETIPEK